jgi:hypothetical protein
VLWRFFKGDSRKDFPEEQWGSKKDTSSFIFPNYLASIYSVLFKFFKRIPQASLGVIVDLTVATPRICIPIRPAKIPQPVPKNIGGL